MPEIAQLTSESFDEVVAGDLPTLVDFWAEWCAPCRAIAPVLEDIAREREGKLRVVKVNADDHPDLVRRLGILSIPTLILFLRGEERVRIVGARPKEQIVRELDLHLS